MPTVRDQARLFTPAARHEDLRALLRFAAQSRVPTGFGYLLDDGKVDPSRPVELWITCRMTHVFSLAALLGVEGAKEIAEHGVRSLSDAFYDRAHGGWFSAIEHEMTGGEARAVDERKAAYAHAFVILAASSASVAGIDGARELLERALANQDERWWDEAAGKVCESYDRTFSECEEYRGVNANMHTTEAYLAAYDATGEETWLRRALRILTWVIDVQASAHAWRIPEHFDTNWEELPDYNIDKPKDPFRPYGYTPGHALEWSRLALHAAGELAARGEDVPEWIVPAAQALSRQAIADGWHADGADGFVYTTDREGQPVARERMHWVLCEALGVASVLADALGEDWADADPEGLGAGELVELADQWWAYASEYLIERPGQWYHELDEHNRVSTNTWPGKPDAYHVAQCLLLPDLPVAPTFARAIEVSGLTLN